MQAIILTMNLGFEIGRNWEKEEKIIVVILWVSLVVKSDYNMPCIRGLFTLLA